MIAPRSYSPRRVDSRSGVAAEFGRLPSRDGDAAARAIEKDRLKSSLAALVAGSSTAARAIDAALARFNSEEPSRNALHELLEAQAWRLAYWRVATDEINYRRFFDVNGLAALRVEAEPVFEATHGFILDLAATGLVDGLRIDHPDGLFDPERYFAYRWHPYANDPKVDYSSEPTTLVEFFLEESEDGTNLKIVESGFDKLPANRRDEAFRMNEGGWNGQIKNIARHVS